MCAQELAKSNQPKPPAPPSDGFDTPDDDIGGGASFIKFDVATQNLYFDRGGKPVRRKPWIAVRCHKEAVRWQDKKIIDRIDGSLSPDIDAMNAAIPQSEWEEGFDGDPKPPWQMQFTIYLVNPEDGSRVIFSNSTFGQKAAYGDLKGRVQFMRNYKGQNVVPIIELSSVMMKTRFGMKPRPHFEVIGWREFGGPSGTPAIAAPVGPAPADEAGGRSVAKPTPAEITMDEIPDHPAPELVPWDDGFPENL